MLHFNCSGKILTYCWLVLDKKYACPETQSVPNVLIRIIVHMEESSKFSYRCRICLLLCMYCMKMIFLQNIESIYFMQLFPLHSGRPEIKSSLGYLTIVNST